MQYSSKLEKLPNSEVAVKVEVAWTELSKAFTKSIANIQKHAEIDGFRKGNAPEKVILERFGEMYILGEAANDIVDILYPQLLDEHKLQSVGYPEISITKIAKDNSLEFTAKIAVLPEVKLPDYQAIAKKISATKKEQKVEDKEISDTLEEIRKNRAHHKLHESGTEHKEGDDKNLVLEELNDDFAKQLGGFQTLNELKEKIKENIFSEKNFKEIERIRLEIVEKIISESKLEVPEVLIKTELEKMLGQFKSDISQHGIKPEDYLKQVNKTEEELRKDWQPEAVKRAKFNIIVIEISKLEKIESDKTELEKQVEQYITTYPDINPQQIRFYLDKMLLNETVMKWLEDRK